MHSSLSTTQRKNKPKTIGTTTVENDTTASASSSLPTTPNTNSDIKKEPPLVAVAYRAQCGTGPFDHNWLNLDCCGLFCAAITYMLHLYGCYAVCYILLPGWMRYEVNGIKYMTFNGRIIGAMFCSVALLAIIAHFRAMTTDPGSVPPDAEPVPALEDEGGFLIEHSNRPKRVCRRCNSYKPPRAHHCSICKRCIIKMDHHCPWVNNCVGIGNHKYFLLFIFYTFVSCIFSLTLLISKFITCTWGFHLHHAATNKSSCIDNPLDIIGIIGLLMESILFGIFTLCMMVDQWEVVTTNLTQIDRLKGADTYLTNMLPGNTRICVAVHEVFGSGATGVAEACSNSMQHLMQHKANYGGFRVDWLSPLSQVRFPEVVKDDIMGFCRPGGGTDSRNEDNLADLNFVPATNAASKKVEVV